MGTLIAGLDSLTISEPIFKDVKYYISGDVPEKISELLRAGGAEQTKYFSDFVSHLICGPNASENDLTDANDLYEIPAATFQWVITCVKLKKLVSTNPYNPSKNQIFSGIVACICKVSPKDVKTLYALITYYGGSAQIKLDSNCTHLIAGAASGSKYNASLTLPPENLKVVTPDWVTESIKAKIQCPYDGYHPKLLKIPTPPPPAVSTLHSLSGTESRISSITGFDFEEGIAKSEVPTQNVSDNKDLESTQALLDKLKQRMPWNHPSSSTTAVSTPSPGLNTVANSTINTHRMPMHLNAPNQTVPQRPNAPINTSCGPQFTQNLQQLIQNQQNIQQGPPTSMSNSPENQQQQTAQHQQQQRMSAMQMHQQRVLQHQIRMEMFQMQRNQENQQQKTLQQQLQQGILGQQNQTQMTQQSMIINQQNQNIGQHQLLGQQNQAANQQNVAVSQQNQMIGQQNQLTAQQSIGQQTQNLGQHNIQGMSQQNQTVGQQTQAINQQNMSLNQPTSQSNVQHNVAQQQQQQNQMLPQQQNQSITQQNQSIGPQTQTLTQQNQIINQQNQSMMQRNQVLVQQDQPINQQVQNLTPTHSLQQHQQQNQQQIPQSIAQSMTQQIQGINTNVNSNVGQLLSGNLIQRQNINQQQLTMSQKQALLNQQQQNLLNAQNQNTTLTREQLLSNQNIQLNQLTSQGQVGQQGQQQHNIMTIAQQQGQQTFTINQQGNQNVQNTNQQQGNISQQTHLINQQSNQSMAMNQQQTLGLIKQQTPNQQNTQQIITQGPNIISAQQRALVNSSQSASTITMTDQQQTQIQNIAQQLQQSASNLAAQTQQNSNAPLQQNWRQTNQQQQNLHIVQQNASQGGIPGQQIIRGQMLQQRAPILQQQIVQNQNILNNPQQQGQHNLLNQQNQQIIQQAGGQQVLVQKQLQQGAQQQIMINQSQLGNSGPHQQILVQGNQQIALQNAQGIPSHGNAQMLSQGGQIINSQSGQQIISQGQQLNQGTQISERQIIGQNNQSGQQIILQGGQQILSQTGQLINSQGQQIIAQGNQGQQILQHGNQQILSQVGQQILTPQGGKQIISPQSGQQIISSQGGQQILSTQGGQQILSSQGGQQIISAQGGQQIISSQNNQQILASQGNQQIISSQGGQQILSSQGGQQIISSQLITSPSGQQIITHGQQIIQPGQQQLPQGCKQIITQGGQQIITQTGQLNQGQSGQQIVQQGQQIVQQGQQIIQQPGQTQQVIPHQGGQQIITQTGGQQIIAQGQQIITQGGQQIIQTIGGQQIITQGGQQMVQQPGQQMVWQQQQFLQQRQQQIIAGQPGAVGQRVSWGTGAGGRQLIHLDAQTHAQLKQMDPKQRALFVAQLQKRRQLTVQRTAQQHQVPLVRGQMQQQVQWVQQQGARVAVPTGEATVVPPSPTGTPAPQKPVQPGQQPPPPHNQLQQVQQQQQQRQQQQLQYAQLQSQRQQQYAHLQRLQAQKEHAQKQGQVIQTAGVGIVAGAVLPGRPESVAPQQAEGSIVAPGPASEQVGNVLAGNNALVVNSRTKTALANMLSIRLQGTQPTPGSEGVTQEPSAAGTLRLMTAAHNAPPRVPGEVVQGLQQRRIPPGAIHHQQLGYGRPPPPPSVPPSPSPAAPPPPRAQFYGHNPNLKLPAHYFLLGCIFHVVEYSSQLAQEWERAVWKHGGEVEKGYSARVTHVLAKTQKHGVVMQALRDVKRCVTAYWLSDTMLRRQVAPPWQALHLPLMYAPHDKPAGRHRVSFTGFGGEERQRIKAMIEHTGAKATTYMTRDNTVLVCRRPEGVKYNKAKEWGIPVVSAQWVTDLLLGNMSALSQIDNPKYQQFNVANPFRMDYALVPHLMNAWKMPINITQESHERVRRGMLPGPPPRRALKRPRVPTPPPTPTQVVLEKPHPDAAPKVAFSSVRDVEPYAQIVRNLGGFVVSQTTEATHLVMSKLVRTPKLVTCLVTARFVLPTSWLIESNKIGKFADENKFSVMTDQFRDTYKCDIPKVLAVGDDRRKLFDGVTFYMTPCVQPSRAQLTEIIELCGGKVDKFRKSFDKINEMHKEKPNSYLVLTVPNDLHLVYYLLQAEKNLNIVCNTELVFSSIMQMKLDVSEYLVKVD